MNCQPFAHFLEYTLRWTLTAEHYVCEKANPPTQKKKKQWVATVRTSHEDYLFNGSNTIILSLLDIICLITVTQLFMWCVSYDTIVAIESAWWPGTYIGTRRAVDITTFHVILDKFQFLYK